MNNDLIYLDNFQWKKNGKFELVLNLDRLKADILLEYQDSTPISSTDNIGVGVIEGDVTLATGTPNLTDLSDHTLSIAFPTLNNILPGKYYDVVIGVKRTITVNGTPVTKAYAFERKVFIPDPVSLGPIELKSSDPEYTTSVDLWTGLKGARVEFTVLKSFLDDLLCKKVPDGITASEIEKAQSRLPFVNVDEYSLIKYAIDAYMKKALSLKNSVGGYSLNPLPYYQNLNASVTEILDRHATNTACAEIAQQRRNGFMAIELIWSYWTEQAMLVQALGTVSLRYQNIPGLHEIEPMMRFDTSPLLPLSNILWGFIQDEQHRTSIHRRNFEYGHAYNLTLEGRAVPRQIGVDNRSPFLAAFHNLLHQASLFFKEYDDKTRNPDAFPLLISLRDVHLLLAEGNHNAYYNMTYTSRLEMLTMQYLLSQPEMQIFLGGRPMMPYEPHVGTLDTIKTIQGWDPVGTTHYYELANVGELLLLSIRYGDWNKTMLTANDAANWAVAFRDQISIYINAYRNVTMVDFSADAPRSSMEERALQPSLLIRRRMALSAPPRSRVKPQLATAQY